MSAPTIGILAPGVMGSALGRPWRACGARVVTTVAGCRVVDAVSGGPPAEGSDTVPFLSGPDCSLFAHLRGPGLTPQVVGTTVGAASAAKMSTAATYKGTKALLLQSLATAAHHGVPDAVVIDLTRALPDVMVDPARDLAAVLAYLTAR